MKAECEVIEEDLAEIEANRHNGKNFVNLMARYNNFDEITPFMVSEFIDRIEVHERDRKGSQQTTQKIDIYFNFIGNYGVAALEIAAGDTGDKGIDFGTAGQDHGAERQGQDQGNLFHFRIPLFFSSGIIT